MQLLIGRFLKNKLLIIKLNQSLFDGLEKSSLYRRAFFYPIKLGLISGCLSVFESTHSINNAFHLDNLVRCFIMRIDVDVRAFKHERCCWIMSVYNNILLPVDGSQQSIDAFKSGIQLAKKMDSKVYLVLVLRNAKNETTNKKRETFLESLGNFASAEGVTVQKELIYGDPRTQIADVLVKRWSIDLILMGATGKGRIAKMTIGSVTEYVLSHAKCAVLISR